MIELLLHDYLILIVLQIIMNAVNMVVTWGPKCDFIFTQWATKEWPIFWLGVFVSFFTTLLTTAYGPIFRKQIKISARHKWQLGIGYLIQYLLKLYVMLLMMTMNGQVCIAIALAMALGCTFFGRYGQVIRKKIFGGKQTPL